jgi:hypothetical protein
MTPDEIKASKDRRRAARVEAKTAQADKEAKDKADQKADRKSGRVAHRESTAEERKVAAKSSARESAKRYRERHPDKIAAYEAARRDEMAAYLKNRYEDRKARGIEPPTEQKAAQAEASRRWRVANPEKVKAARAARRDEMADYLKNRYDTRKAAGIEPTAEQKAAQAEASRRWRANNPEKVKAARIDNRDKQAAYHHAYRNNPETPVGAKRAFIQGVKDAGCCDLCGDSRPYVLEFDHLVPATKLFSVSRMVVPNRHSLDDLKKETAKCRLLCASCHRIHTHKQNRAFRAERVADDERARRTEEAPTRQAAEEALIRKMFEEDHP